MGEFEKVKQNRFGQQGVNAIAAVRQEIRDRYYVIRDFVATRPFGSMLAFLALASIEYLDVVNIINVVSKWPVATGSEHTAAVVGVLFFTFCDSFNSRLCNRCII